MSEAYRQHPRISMPTSPFRMSRNTPFTCTEPPLHPRSAAVAYPQCVTEHRQTMGMLRKRLFGCIRR